MDLKQVTTEALKEVIDMVKDSKSFVKEQAPDLAKEIILNAKVSALYNLIVGVIFFALSVNYLVYIAGVDSDPEAKVKGYQFGLAITSGIAALISGFGTLCTIESIISLITAPKMFILKELSKAVSKDK